MNENEKRVRAALEALCNAWHVIKVMEAVENTPDEIALTTEAHRRFYAKLDEVSKFFASSMS